jgi:glycosyltransferase involved in cell wall biosynthesis
MKAKVTVLIPTLNEEATIGQVIDKIPVRVLSDEGYDTVIYVIDGDSEDATQQKALAMTRTNGFGNRALTAWLTCSLKKT